MTDPLLTRVLGRLLPASLGGQVRPAQPVSPTRVQEVPRRPVPGCTVSIAFGYVGTASSNVGSHVLLTGAGALNYFRSASAGNPTRVQPIDTETFTAFELAGTGFGNQLYSRNGDTDGRFAYLYREGWQSIWKVDLDAGSMTEVVTGLGSVTYIADLSVLEGAPYGYAIDDTGKVWRWDRSAEPTTASVYITPPVGGGTLFELVTQTADGRIWIAGSQSGTTGAVIGYEPDGSTLFAWYTPSGFFVEGIARIGNNVLALYEDGSSVAHLVLICPASGTVTDVTANCTVDGVAFATYYASNGYRTKLHSKGNRVGFVGLDYSIYVGTAA